MKRDIAQLDRRSFVIGATLASVGLAGCLGGGGDGDSGDNGNGDNGDFIDDEPDYGDWFSNTGNYEGTYDYTDQDSVTVEVGTGSQGYQFEPAAIAISTGTTVTWEWTGSGGGHNVVPEEGPAGFEHQDIVSESGYTYDYEFTSEDAGTTTYKCVPHEGQGMKGAVHVVE